MAEFDITAVFKVSGLTEVKAAFKGIGNAADDVSKNFDKFTKSLGTVTKNIGLLTAAATAAGVAIVSLTKKNAEYADSLGDVSTVTGFTTDEIQGFVFAAAKAGNEAGESTKGLERFAAALGDLQRTGGGSLETAFKDTDPAFLNVLKNTNDVSDAFDLYLERVRVLPTEQQKFAASVDIFGKRLAGSVTELVAAGGSIGEFTESARQAGAVLSGETIEANGQFVGSLKTLGVVLQTTSTNFTTLFIPAIQGVSQRLQAFVNENSQAILDKIKPALDVLTETFLGFVDILLTGKLDAGNAKAQELYKNFILIKDAVVGAFQLGTEVLTAFFAALDPIAAILGLDSGLQLGLGLLILQFTGLFKVITSFAGLTISIVNFFGVFLLNIPKLLVNLKLLGEGFAAIRTAFLAFSALILANPFALIVVGIVAVVAAIALIIDKTIGFEAAWQAVKDAAGVAFEFIKTGLAAVGSFFADIGRAFVEGFIAATPGLQQFFAQAATLVQGFVTQVIDFFKGIPDGILALISGLGAAVGAVFEGIFKGIQLAFDALINAIKTGITTVSSLIKSAYEGLVSLVGNAKTQQGTIQAPPRPSGVTVNRFAGGGDVIGPGTSTSDSILAALSNGEFVMNAKAVRKYGSNFMSAINRGIFNLKGYAQGGLVNDLNNIAMSPFMMTNNLEMQPVQSSSGGNAANFFLDGQKYQFNGSDQTIRNLQRSMRRSDNAKAVKPSRWNQ